MVGLFVLWIVFFFLVRCCWSEIASSTGPTWQETRALYGMIVVMVEFGGDAFVVECSGKI